MKIPVWAKPILLFFTVIFSVLLVTSFFFIYTAATTQQKETVARPMDTSTEIAVEPLSSPEASAETAQVLGKTQYSLSASKLYLLINAHRENFNLPKLQPNAQLEASAQLKLSDMIEKEYFRHEDPDQQSTWHFIQVAGYQYQKAGENLAFNIGSEWDIFQAWLKSETHNKQMLDSVYTDIGLAIDCDSVEDPNYKCIVVAHFGKK